MEQTLTSEQLAQFMETGYVVAPNVFTPADLEPLRQEIAGLVDAAARDLHEGGKLDTLFEDEPFETRLARIAAYSPEAGEFVLSRIKGKVGGGHTGPAMFDAIRQPKLLRVIEDIIGPEIVGSSVYRIRPKLPHHMEGVVPWHQDSGYFMSHCDRVQIVICWVPLVDATPENGCLQVIPRAHRQGVFKHCTRVNAPFLVIPDDDLPPIEPVTVAMPAGSVLLMTNLTPHRSTENYADHVRWSIDLRYQSADAPNNVGQAPESQFNLEEARELACYPPEADFVIQSPSHPEREVRSLAEFEALRRRYETTVFPPLEGLARWKESVEV